MWTEATQEIKDFFYNNDVKKYETQYDKESKTKKWIITTSKGNEEFVQDFNFSFFDKE